MSIWKDIWAEWTDEEWEHFQRLQKKFQIDMEKKSDKEKELAQNRLDRCLLLAIKTS